MYCCIIYSVFKDLKPLIYEENSKFQEMAKKHWSKRDPAFLLSFKKEFSQYQELCWLDKLEAALNYPRTYKEINTVSISYGENEEKLEMIHKQNLLEVVSGILIFYTYATNFC